MSEPSGPGPLAGSPRFELLEHTADIGVRVVGSHPAEVFRTAVTGLFSVMLDALPDNPSCQHKLELNATDYPDLLCDFLNQMLYLFDAEKLVPLGMRFEQLEPSRLRSNVTFGKFDPTQIGVRTYVKAVTYHQLKFQSISDQTIAEFFLDV